MFRKIGEWFWRGDALRQVRGKFDAKARAHAVASADLLDASNSLGVAEGTLLAQGLLLTEATVRAATVLGFAADAEGTPLDDAAVRDRLVALRVPATEIDGAKQALRRPHEPAADAPKAPQLAMLRRVAGELVRDAGQRTSTPGQFLFQRWVRIFFAVAALGVFVTAMWIHPWWLRDKARGATWTASSAAPNPGNAASGTLGWPPADSFFMTTGEDVPWLIIDLGKTESISRMRVVNRIHSPDNAIPLKVEVSTDKQTWTTVAERRESFATCVISFPSIKARYVRLSVDHKTVFHLNNVQIL